ncbi:MAG: thioesterase [Euryarchaeota archaeon]|nr:thioesterase [Euryarchaeota archaeon]|tara:strand:- start:673 stop:1107 length:435 start_codon:yes stop_codon:yes gene_type:complete
MDQPLGNWPISMEITVQWGDMDALNHVNHTVFLTWMETARMAYFDECGMMDILESENIGPILAAIKADFLLPVVYPDTVVVQTTITRLGNSSFDMDYKITSTDRGGGLVATGSASGVLCDYSTGKSTPISDSLRSRIIALESAV